MILLSILAALQLNPLFTDHAVLQRGVPIPVWGRGAQSGERLALSFAGTNCWTRANADGTFRFLVPPRTAGGPFDLAVASDTGETAVARDVLIGEVWLCSGQSNMAFGMGSAEPGWGEEEDDLLRSFRVHGQPGFGEQTEAKGAWQAATPRTAKGFSAVATFFARALRRELGVPVGILTAADGGTRIEAWSSAAALAETGAGRAALAEFAAGLANPKFWTDSGTCASRAPPDDDGPTEEALGWVQPDADIAAWRRVMVPSSFSDLEGRDFNGAVWYVRDVVVPETMRGRDLVFRIPGVDKHDKTYVNGVRVGETGKGQETRFYAAVRRYRVPAELIGKDGRARLAIRVWSQINAGGIGTADGSFSLAAEEGPDEEVDLCGFWRWRIERDCGRVAGGTAGYVPGNANAPHALFDVKIAPLATYAIRGAIWYQGESNENNAPSYRDSLAALVRDWRHRWGQGDFPFIVVQLAGYGELADFNARSPWAEIRQGLLELSLVDPNFGIASAVDIGSVDNIHPKNKLEVGERLARWALNRAYGRTDLLPTGPRAVSATVRNGRVSVRFVDCGRGLQAKGPLKGFYLKDAKGAFHAAQAAIAGRDAVTVFAPDCPAPLEVRFAWAKNPASLALVNSDGLPASPFRLDCAGKLPAGDVVIDATWLVGTEASGRTFRGAADGSTRISAGVAITGWTDRGGGVWGAKLPNGPDGKPLYTECLFVNGRRAQRSRFPADGGFFRVTSVTQLVCAASGTGNRIEVGVDGNRAEGKILAAMKPEELAFAQLLAHIRWDVARYPIVSFADGKVSVDAAPMKKWNKWTTNDFYALENVRGAFTEPGQWFCDGCAGEVLYRPLDGETIREAVVPAPGLETVLSVRGAKDVTFENVTFAFTAPAGSKGPSRLAPCQAATIATAAVLVEDSTNVVFRNCRFEHLGGYALWFREGCRGGGAFDCEMKDLGAGGVRLGGHRKLSEKDLAASVETSPWITSGVAVENCLVAHGGRFHPAGVGVLLAHACDCSVVHNDILDLYYTGVSVGWVWGYAGSPAQRNTVAFNHIRDIGQSRLADMGGIYLLGTAFGTCVSNNVIHGVHSYSYGGWGLYPDEGSEGLILENNLVYDTDDASFHQHYGRDNILRNNILVDSKAGQIAVTRAEPHRSLTVERNIVLWTQGDAFNKYHGTKSEKAKIDWKGNLWWRTDGKEVFNGTSFVEWQKRVKDEGSAFSDPGFADWRNRDFTLKPDSPAFKVGFRPFDPSLAGRNDGAQEEGHY